MRVLLVQSAHSPGSVHYRINEPAREIRKAGIDVVARVGIKTTMSRSSDGSEPMVVDVDSEGADVVVLQLPKTAEMLQILQILQSKGVAVVVDMDDLLSGVPFGHMGHRKLVRQGMARAGLDCTREADLVTVSTPALLEEYATHGRGVVVPNAVPRWVAELPAAYERDPQIVTVGWTGNVLGHPYDLQEMGSGLRQALDRTAGASRFVILGQKFDAKQRLGLALEPDEVPWVHDANEYIVRMGEVFDVGLAPLRLDRFNQCKSWLKPLEYAARGVLSVRARSADYERLALGLPAKAPKDWAKWITVAVQDADRRRELAAAAHEKVLAGHLTEHTAERWIDAWRQALDNAARRRGTRAGLGAVAAEAASA